jgi:hypothetical protein
VPSEGRLADRCKSADLQIKLEDDYRMLTSRVLSGVRRLCTGALACTYMSTMIALSGAPGTAAAMQPLYTMTLPGGETAVVFSNGVAQVFSKDRTKVQTRLFASIPKYGEIAPNAGLPDKGHLLADLAAGPKTPYADGRVIVVFRQGVSAAQDVQQFDKATMLQLRTSLAQHQLAAVPQYTNDATTNRALATIGADRTERMFQQFNRSTLSSMHMSVQNAAGMETLDFSNAYRLHITGASVHSAVQTLLKLRSVAYASPDWHVATMQSPEIEIPQATIQAARQALPLARTSQTSMNLPTNYAVSASAQSMLNAPSDNAMVAFDEIDKTYHQLPGQGETITNVSLGDLDDAGAASNAKDPCGVYARVYGPTTEVIGGQRYLNLPSMPLIPTYTSDANGHLDGTGEVCGVDPFITEIGLDFSMMAPLPHNLQRGGEQGSGLSDLLGIAPGANYRLVVPGTAAASISDVDAALLGAAMQTPQPNVITASIGFGYDLQGFPSRYLEDDPLTESLIAAIVHRYNIVVCVSAGDGTRTTTTVAIGPSGGSVPTNLIAQGGQPTDLNDVGFSTVASQDFDSGSIDVGGTTLDDIFAAPPQDPHFASLHNQHAFAETRWTGFTNFSSGFGTRVNVSAPSDNVLSLTHVFGGASDAVAVVLEGGTSASAPQAAAAAAILLQVGQLSGHPFRNAAAVRSFLIANGTAVPNVPQADTTINVGPQIDLGEAVEKLVGHQVAPSVPRVAIEQRQNAGNLDGAFVSATDPTHINLYGADETAWITVAPDWEGLNDGASHAYSLYVTGKPGQQLATTAFARLQPADILNAAGLPLASSASRTVNLTYAALTGRRVVAQTSFSMTFGPAAAKTTQLHAPIVPAVVTGATIPVSYDITNANLIGTPSVIVSQPGRIDPATGNLFHPAYIAPLPAGLKGTVNVPVSALQGGGIYGIAIAFGPVSFKLNAPLPTLSDFAFTRVAPANDGRPIAPLLSYNGSTPGHFLEVPYNGSFQLSYNVSNVSGATGAMLEISAAGPTEWGSYNPFNNPNGSIIDHNGTDSGSVYSAPLPGMSGTVTLSGVHANLIPTLYETVRVIPMRGDAPAGEAGDVSTITMDGVLAADGGYINNGYGVNASGIDGFITSSQSTATGQTLTSLETFDQTSNGITKTVESDNGSTFYTFGWGIFGNDLGLFGDQLVNPPYSTTSGLLNTVASGSVGAAWTPPFPQATFALDEGAANQVSDVGAFLASDTSAALTDSYRMFTSNLTAGTFSSEYDVSAPIQTFGYPDYTHLSEDTNTDQGVLAAGDFTKFCGAPTIVTVDLKTFATDAFAGIGRGIPFGMGVDSGTNKAAVTTVCDGGLSIYDLATKTGTEVTLPGDRTTGFSLFNGVYVMADQTAHEFLVAQPVSGDAPTNNNALSSVLVYDESGNLLKTLERFQLNGVYLQFRYDNLQLNPSRHTGYFFGPASQELEPFSY